MVTRRDYSLLVGINNTTYHERAFEKAENQLLYKNLQSQITMFVIQIHQQINLLKSQLLAFKLKLTIFKIPLISRGNLFHTCAPEYLKDQWPYIVFKITYCNIHKTLPIFITMLLIYPREKCIKI